MRRSQIANSDLPKTGIKVSDGPIVCMAAVSIRSTDRLGLFARAWSDKQMVAYAVVLCSALLAGIIVSHEYWLWLFASVAIPLVLMWPVHLSLGIFALLIPFDQIAVLGRQQSGTTLTWVVGGGATIILLATAFVSRRLEPPPHAALWWTLFVVWSAVTSMWALDPAVTFQRLPTVASFGLFYVVAVSVRVRKAELVWVFLLSIIGGCAAAGYVSLAYYHGMLQQETMRATLVVGNRETDPNQFAASLILPISLGFGGFLSLWASRGKADLIRRLASISLLIVTLSMVFAVFLSMSRGGVVSIAVIMLVYTLRFRVTWKTLVPLTAVLLLLLVTPQLFFARLAQASDSGGAGRVDVWKVGLLILRYHGILGTGLDNFPIAFERYYVNSAMLLGGRGRGSHNIYLGVWAELGLVGFVLFIAALRSQLRMAARAMKKLLVPTPYLVACEAACWATLASGLFLDILWRKQFWFSWVLLAMATRVARWETGNFMPGPPLRQWQVRLFNSITGEQQA